MSRGASSNVVRMVAILLFFIFSAIKWSVILVDSWLFDWLIFFGARVCVYVCVCVRACVRVRVHVHVCVNLRVCMYIRWRWKGRNDIKLVYYNKSNIFSGVRDFLESLFTGHAPVSLRFRLITLFEADLSAKFYLRSRAGKMVFGEAIGRVAGPGLKVFS